MKIIVLVIIFISVVSCLFSQCQFPVTHTSGSKIINGINVTVTSTGLVDTNSVYCINAKPYFIGYTWSSGKAQNGTYNFQFNPPVKSVSLNFVGISRINSHIEIIKLYSNGIHYPIPNKGKSNGCDTMADLTSDGNIIGCNNCNVSGWKETIINGNISSISVFDSVVIGNPAGAIFSLFFCDKSLSGLDTTKQTQTICKGKSYNFYTQILTNAGTYSHKLKNRNGYDSLILLTLSVIDSSTYSFSRILCSGQSYFFNNQNLTTSGTYKDTFTSSNGCDSFVFLHLHVKDTSYHFFTHITPCDPNASFMFNGLARTQSGIYSAKYFNSVGCDSTAVLNLTIRKPSSFTIPKTLCPGDSFMFNGSPRTTTGTYVQTIINGNSVGCDSTITLNLNVLTNPAPITIQVSGCSPFTYNGKTYMNSTTFLDTIKSVLGCDSLYRTNIIQLKPPPITAPEVNNIVCDSIRLNNRLYTNSFSFVDTFRTVGTVCDSVYRKTNYAIRYTPQIGLKERDTIMRGSQVTLRPFSATNYLWSTGQTTKDISFKLTEDRQLYLIAWNEEPCRDTAYISLVAEELAIVGMPTGFSPTGEYPENRTLRPNINGRLEYFHMMVFNRWGEKVYETFDTQPLGWNGIYKGEPAPKGLYGYVIEYRTLGIIYHKSGEVMLVR